MVGLRMTFNPLPELSGNSGRICRAGEIKLPGLFVHVPEEVCADIAPHRAHHLQRASILGGIWRVHLSRADKKPFAIEEKIILADCK